MWHGDGFLFHGGRDREVPLAGGTIRIGGTLAHIDPSSRTITDLPDAHLKFETIPRLGHVPPIGWPQLAWAALQSVG